MKPTQAKEPNDIMAQLISEMKNKCPWKHFWPPFWQKQSKDFLAFITQTITQKYIYQVMLTFWKSNFHILYLVRFVNSRKKTLCDCYLTKNMLSTRCVPQNYYEYILLQAICLLIMVWMFYLCFWGKKIFWEWREDNVSKKARKKGGSLWQNSSICHKSSRIMYLGT